MQINRVVNKTKYTKIIKTLFVPLLVLKRQNAYDSFIGPCEENFDNIDYIEIVIQW